MVCMRWPNQPNWLVLCGAFLLHAGIKGQQPPAAVQADVRQGIDALERSNFSSAEEHLSRALEADPNLSEVRANLGLAYYADHKYSQAIEAFKEALKQDSSLRTAQTFLPLSLAALRRCQEAVPGLRREFSSHPDLKLRRVIGLSLEQCLYESGALAEADEVTQALLAKYPDDIDVLYAVGQMYGKLSSEIYLRLMKVAPHSVRGYQVMAEVAATEGNWQGAIDSYREALKLDPGLPGAHLQIGVLTLEHSTDPNAWHEALQELNAELRINPASGEAEYEMGEAYRKHGQDPEAISAFRQALRLDPSLVEARVELAKVLRQDGRKQEAISTLEPARQSAPGNAAVHFLLAQLYRDLGRAADARQEEEAFKKLQDAGNSREWTSGDKRSPPL